jgi:hypothetical protein
MALRFPLLHVLVTLVTFALLLALTVTFLQTYRRSKAPFTLGLVVFAAVLTLQAFLRVVLTLQRILRAPFLSPMEADALDTLTDVAEIAAVGVLLWNVNK